MKAGEFDKFFEYYLCDAFNRPIQHIAIYCRFHKSLVAVDYKNETVIIDDIKAPNFKRLCDLTYKNKRLASIGEYLESPGVMDGFEHHFYFQIEDFGEKTISGDNLWFYSEDCPQRATVGGIPSDDVKYMMGLIKDLNEVLVKYGVTLRLE